MANINELCGDPLFQLNFGLWLAQPLPEYADIKPVFYNNGFIVAAIDQRLTLPLAVRSRLVDSGLACQDAVVPDLLYRRTADECYCTVECKGKSFGTASTTSKQARALLLLTETNAFRTAIFKPNANKNVLGYLTRNDQCEQLTQTITDLKAELTDKGFLPGTAFCFGIYPAENAICLSLGEEAKRELGFKGTSPYEIMPVSTDTDPRPLYFIPYDAIYPERDTEEERICRQILYGKILGQVISAIGWSLSPCEVVFTIDGLLNEVTCNLYDIIDDPGTKKPIRSLVKIFMKELIDSLDENIRQQAIHSPDRGWVFNISSKSYQDEFLKQLCRFKPGGMKLNEQVEQTELLFDV